MRELVFLANAIPSVFPDLADGALCVMKVESRPGRFPHIAFASEELGHQFMKGRQIGSECAIQRVSALLPDQAAIAKQKDVLLFELPEQVARYLANSRTYGFESHIFSFEEAERRLQRAL